MYLLRTFFWKVCTKVAQIFGLPFSTVELMHSLPQIMFGYILGDLNNHLVTLPYTFRGKNGQNMVVLSALPDRISNKAEDFICLAWSWLSTLVPNDEIFLSN
jgi:hypothetical protein